MTLFWIGFHLFVFAMLALDLGLFHRHAHQIKVKEALIWSGVWVSLALSFNAIVYFWRGPEPALQFLTGYLIEYSLSVDNIFVFLMIFSYFRVAPEHQHKVLFWGILGALGMRAVFIVVGVTLIERFHWTIYLFGAFLVYTGIKMAFQKNEDMDPGQSPVFKFFRRWVPVSQNLEGSKFFVRQNGKLLATPLFIVLLVVETTDVIFAVDSIPAILSITSDSFIVYTSNIFAILGLRSLYFALSGAIRLFHYLNYGLSFILSFVGLKMLLSHFYKISITTSLGVIAGALILSVAASVFWPQKHDTADNSKIT